MSHPHWQLAFTLPNLSFSAREGARSELTLGLEGIAVVSASDSRVTEITEWSDAARRFLESFHDGNGKPITPAVLIVRDDWYCGMGQDPEPVISFRNAVATAAILPFRAQWPSDGWSGVSWSEAFDHHPARLRPDGSKFDSWTPALNSIGFRLQGLCLTPDLRVPRIELQHTDELLAERLGRVWLQRYRRGKEKRKTARVFRSLEAAYEALGVRFRNYSSLSEIGLNAVPWTTAIEVLASPAKGQTSRWDCTRLIQQHDFSDQRLRRRKCWVKTESGRRHMTLAQRVFVRLHKARSKFVHGDRVSVRLLLTTGDEAPPLLSLASTVYRTALMAYLDGHWPDTRPPPSRGSSITEHLKFRLQSIHYENHLLQAIGKSYWD